MDSKQLALLCRAFADDKKAEDIVILDLRELPGVTDFMVLCTGTSEPHLRAVEEGISRKLRDEHGIRPRTVDGTRHSGWIVIDYVDVLVHVMKKEARERYDLEGLWNDAPRVRVAAKKVGKKKSAAGSFEQALAATMNPTSEPATATKPKAKAKVKAKAKPKAKAKAAAKAE